MKCLDRSVNFRHRKQVRHHFVSLSLPSGCRFFTSLLYHSSYKCNNCLEASSRSRLSYKMARDVIQVITVAKRVNNSTKVLTHFTFRKISQENSHSQHIFYNSTFSYLKIIMSCITPYLFYVIFRLL